MGAKPVLLRIKSASVNGVYEVAIMCIKVFDLAYFTNILLALFDFTYPSTRPSKRSDGRETGFAPD